MTDFTQLYPQTSPKLWQKVANLPLPTVDNECFTPPNLTSDAISLDSIAKDSKATVWLIPLFNALFIEQHVILMHAKERNLDMPMDEPEYLPAIWTDNQLTTPARICFAHGYFASALHEISHWSIAGQQRRQLNDFGYWYAPDGRNEQQQSHFEKVEIKPQAIECLLTLACYTSLGYPFSVSQDNLFATFDTSHSTFEADVFALAQQFLQQPSLLPTDAQRLLAVLFHLCNASLIADLKQV